jgi:hypothetical protein
VVQRSELRVGCFCWIHELEWVEGQRKAMKGLQSAQALALLLFLAFLPLWWIPLAWWLAYSPSAVFGAIGQLGLAIEGTLVLVIPLACLAIVVAIAAFLFRRTRRCALLYGGAAAVFVTSFLVGERYLQGFVWRDAVFRFERRSQPLVQAVQSYRAKHGQPPAALEDLVPAYLKEVPLTGIGVRSNYEYIVGEKASAYGENPWVLIVEPPCHMMCFDLLLYFPLQNYPHTGYGGWLEPIGSWAYLHE